MPRPSASKAVPGPAGAMFHGGAGLDAEDHPAAGQHVERGHCLDQHAPMAVGDRGHEGAELNFS